MSEERFEVFGNIIKDNEDIPALLNNYQATIRLNELNDKVKELEQKLKEKDNLIEFCREEIGKRNKKIKEIVERDRKLFDNKNKELEKLKQQLTEKQNTIDKINKEFVQAVHDWKALCAEKDKEIEKLKQQNTLLENENGKLAKELIMGKYKKAQKEVSFGKQLAIQELEKVKNTLKHFCNIHSDEYYGVKAEVKGIELDVCESIDYQIKALKGNNDEPRQSN